MPQLHPSQRRRSKAVLSSTASYNTPTLTGTPTTSTSTSVAITGEAIGDFIFIYSQRSATAVNSIDASFTDIASIQQGTSSGNNVSQRAGYMFADTASEVSGTWTNARRMICLMFTNVDTISPIHAVASTQGSGTTITFPALTLTRPCLLIRGVSLRGDSGQTITMPAGLGTEYSVASGGNGRSTMAFSTGPVSIVTSDSGAQSAAGNWVSFSLALAGTII